jgi:hypothetical protein
LSHRLLTAASIAVLLLEGCAQPVPSPTVAVDTMNEGIAKTCTFTPMQPTAGGSVDATLTMTNDGWCAYRATEKQGQAYALGLVKLRPEHGELQIRKWNNETRVEYQPTAGFIGADKFAVLLRSTAGGADATVNIAATVARGEGVAAAPPPATETKPTTTTRRRTPVRRTTTPVHKPTT